MFSRRQDALCLPLYLSLPVLTFLYAHAIIMETLATGEDTAEDTSLFQFLFLLIVAAICGSIGRAIVGYSHGGCLVSIALGFIGALFGKWLADILGLPLVFRLSIGGHSFPILWSIIGAALFVAVINLISGRRGR